MPQFYCCFEENNRLSYKCHYIMYYFISTFFLTYTYYYMYLFIRATEQACVCVGVMRSRARKTIKITVPDTRAHHFIGSDCRENRLLRTVCAWPWCRVHTMPMLMHIYVPLLLVPQPEGRRETGRERERKTKTRKKERERQPRMKS